jgi:CMP-N,N'-diacetyllegionaminic acid synthase
MRVLAVVPARGGSRGLPGKNVRSMAGLPLLVHSLRCAKLAPEITRCIVSTDGDDIAAIARTHGGDVPFLRPAELARDDTPMIPVLQHALAAIEEEERSTYDALLLLDPTSPFRLPEEIGRAVAMLSADPSAVGVVACSQPSFNPFWVGVVERDGVLESAFPSEQSHARRQDVKRFLRINGALYLWRASFLRSAPTSWLAAGKHLYLDMPEQRAFSIDDEFQFNVAELLLVQGLIEVPWWKKSDR